MFQQTKTYEITIAIMTIKVSVDNDIRQKDNNVYLPNLKQITQQSQYQLETVQR